jgi:hypothetical protein
METGIIHSTEGAPADRVRAHSQSGANVKFDQQSLECARTLAGKDREEISRHIDQLNREWDVERYLQTNASILALTGVVLGATVSKKFFLLPGAVLSFFLQHAVQGWCPPIPVFRRMGVRTRKEINREKYALKAVRGDFDHLTPEARTEPERQPQDSSQGAS